MSEGMEQLVKQLDQAEKEIDRLRGELKKIADYNWEFSDETLEGDIGRLQTWARVALSPLVYRFRVNTPGKVEMTTVFYDKDSADWFADLLQYTGWSWTYEETRL